MTKRRCSRCDGPYPDHRDGLCAACKTLRATTSRREKGPPCPNCRKPVEVGQVVLPWDDAGEMHADCDHPFSLKVERHDGEPEPVVLLGEPMVYFPVANLSTNKDETIAKLREALRQFARIADMSERLKPGETVGVNIDRCRDARSALTSTKKEG